MTMKRVKMKTHVSIPKRQRRFGLGETPAELEEIKKRVIEGCHTATTLASELRSARGTWDCAQDYIHKSGESSPGCALKFLHISQEAVALATLLKSYRDTGCNLIDKSSKDTILTCKPYHMSLVNTINEGNAYVRDGSHGVASVLVQSASSSVDALRSCLSGDIDKAKEHTALANKFAGTGHALARKVYITGKDPHSEESRKQTREESDLYRSMLSRIYGTPEERRRAAAKKPVFLTRVPGIPAEPEEEALALEPFVPELPAELMPSEPEYISTIPSVVTSSPKVIVEMEPRISIIPGEQTIKSSRKRRARLFIPADLTGVDRAFETELMRSSNQYIARYAKAMHDIGSGDTKKIAYKTGVHVKTVFDAMTKYPELARLRLMYKAAARTAREQRKSK